MNQVQDIFFGSTGLDRDSDKRLIAQGDTDVRVNLIPSADGNHNVLTSIRGNRLLAELWEQAEPTSFGYQTKGGADYLHFGFTDRNPVTGVWMSIHRHGVAHVEDTGYTEAYTSTDGLMWTLKGTIYDATDLDERGASGGYTSTGRLVVFVLVYDTGTATPHIKLTRLYSDDDATTFTTTDILTFTPGEWYLPYSRLVELENGTLLIGAYAKIAGVYHIGVFRSTDNGVTWSWESKDDTSTNYELSEPVIAYLGNNEVLMMVRKINGTCYRQYYSSNAGYSFADQGDITFDSWAVIAGTRDRPAFLNVWDYYGTRIVACYYACTDTQDFKVVYAKAQDISAGVSAWDADTKQTIYANLYNYQGMGFTRDGYQSVVHINNQWQGIGSIYLESADGRSNLTFFQSPFSNKDAVLSQLTATKTVVGDCYDSKRNCQYIFQYDADGEHNILKYSYDTGELTYLVWANTKIGLTTAKIFDACVIGDYLFWNPRSSSPRSINVKWAENYYLYNQVVSELTYAVGMEIAVYGRIMEVVSAQTGTDIIADIKAGNYYYSRDTGNRCYYTMDQYFYNYVEQPKYAPTFAYATDTSRRVNNLRKQIFQFCYRYILDDGSVSVVSPYSDTAIANAETTTGEIATDGSVYNITVDNKLNITVAYPTDIAEQNLSAIEILVRNVDATGWGLWKSAYKVPWEHIIDGDTNFSFYNDRNYEIVDQIEVARVYSALPSLANCQASLMNNRIAYGGVTEGINNITPIVTLTPTLSELAPYSTGTLVATYVITGEEVSGGARYTIQIPGAATRDHIIVVTLNSESATYTCLPADEVEDTFVNNLRAFIDGNFRLARSVTADTATDTVYFDISTALYDYSAIQYSSPTPAFYRTKGFKTGANHKFCIFYYDALMRRSGAMVNEDTSLGTAIDVPFVAESMMTNPGYVYKYTIDWSINHPPPDDAVYWRWGYAGNSTMTWFVWYQVDSWIPDGTSTVAMTLTTLESTYPTTYPNVNLSAYEFQKGDRIRVVIPPPSGAPTAYPIPYTTFFDEEILDYDPATYTITIKYITPGGAANGMIIEIYRPQKSEDITYYEYGDLYEVYTVSGVRYHKGASQNQTSALAATGTFTEGDIYHITRLIIDAGGTTDDVILPVESMWASDFYDSEVWAQGKVGFVDLVGKVTLNNIRHSDQYIQNTKVNGLSSFQYLNYKPITNKFGDIVAMTEIGHTLNVYCEGNVISVPIGRTAYTDAEGNDNVVVSDQILGTERIGADEYGTVFPESVCKVGTHVYFFDSRKGVFVRDSLNGSYPISGKFATEQGWVNYKMESYFKERAKLIRDAGESNYKVITGWDEEKKLLVVAFVDTDAIYNEIVCFHEPSNRWATFLMYYNDISPDNNLPTWMSKSGNAMLSYLQEVYIHDSTADFCRFYGNQYGIENRVYLSLPTEVLFESIGVDCNQLLDLDTIYVHTNESSSGYMLSRIPDVWWKKIEGVWRSPYLRNLMTYGSVNIKYLFSGDFLRGKCIENRLTKSSVSTELNINKVEITIEKSNF